MDSSQAFPNSQPTDRMIMNKTAPESPPTNGPPADWLEVVRKQAANLRFGSIQITVHDGRVTQVESIEKTRFVATRDDAAGNR